MSMRALHQTVEPALKAKWQVYRDKLFSKIVQDKDMELGWHLAGDGVKGARCGQEIFTACPTGLEGHTKRRKTIYCHDATCPKCYEHETWLLAGDQDDRINKIQRAYDFEGVDLERCQFILSPPKELYQLFETEQGFDIVRREAYRLARLAGVVGGVVMIHQYRGKKPVMDKIRNGADAPDQWHVHFDGLSPYRFVEKSTGKKVSTVEAMNYPSGELRLDPTITKSNDMYMATGWVYKYVGFLAARWASTRDRIAYELSHATFRAPTSSGGHKGAIARWYGILSCNSAKRHVTEMEEPVLCENRECLRQCNDYSDESCDSDVFIRESTRKTTIYRYTLDLETLAKRLARYKLSRSASWAPGNTTLKPVMGEAYDVFPQLVSSGPRIGQARF